MREEKKSMKSNMKIVAIQGSYRKNGITSTLLQYACNKLAAAGNEVEYINLHEKTLSIVKGAENVWKRKNVFIRQMICLR